MFSLGNLGPNVLSMLAVVLLRSASFEPPDTTAKAGDGVKFRHLFSRQTRLALSATPARNLFTSALLVAAIAVGWFLPDLLPWWGWLLAFLVGFVGIAFLGRFWADKDLAERERLAGPVVE